MSTPQYQERAFPYVMTEDASEIQPGMTLRAYLAAKAMQGYLAGRNSNNSSIDSHAAHVAEDCVQYADALIFALNQAKP